MTHASKQKSISYYFDARSFKNFEPKNWKVAKNPLGINFFTLWLRRNPIWKVFMPNNACLSRRSPGRVQRPKSFNIDPALKSVNLQYNTLGPCVAGPNVSLIKCLMFQVLFCFIIFYKLWALKNLYFHFCKVIKKLK